MDFGLTKEQTLIQKMAREFTDKIIFPQRKRIDEENEVPEDIMRGLRDLELFGIPYQEAYGGSGGGYSQYVLVMEQLARGSSGVGMILSAHTLGLGAINAFGTEEQKKKFMFKACKGEEIASFAFTEPGTGSDPKQIASTAIADGDSFVLNGTKRFISNAGYPGPMVFFARETENNQLSAFVVDKFCEGYSVSEPWDKMGVRGCKLLDVYLKDVRVPAENMLGKTGMGYPVLQFGISFGKVGIASCILGGILLAMEEGIRYAKEKTHRDQPIAKFQSIQLKVADLVVKYQVASQMTYRLGWLAERANDPEKFAQEAAITKIYVTATGVETARLALDIHGSYGLMNDYIVSQLWRDSIIGPQIEGVEDMQKLIVAGAALKG